MCQQLQQQTDCHLIVHHSDDKMINMENVHRYTQLCG